MKIKDIFNINNIKSYIEGNFKYYYDRIIGEPEYLREQRLYRLYMCKDSCVQSGACDFCGCPTQKKIFVDESCNHGERFPNIMDEKEWNEYKEENGINGQYIRGEAPSGDKPLK